MKNATCRAEGAQPLRDGGKSDSGNIATSVNMAPCKRSINLETSQPDFLSKFANTVC